MHRARALKENPKILAPMSTSSRPPWDILSYLDPSAAVDDDNDGTASPSTTTTPDPVPLPSPSLADPSLAGLLAAAGSVPALVCGQSCALASLTRADGTASGGSLS